MKILNWTLNEALLIIFQTEKYSITQNINNNGKGIPGKHCLFKNVEQIHYILIHLLFLIKRALPICIKITKSEADWEPMQRSTREGRISQPQGNG